MAIMTAKYPQDSNKQINTVVTIAPCFVFKTTALQEFFGALTRRRNLSDEITDDLEDRNLADEFLDDFEEEEQELVATGKEGRNLAWGWYGANYASR